MTDFLSSVVQRSFGSPAAIRPRMTFLFEPAFPHSEPAHETASLREVDASSGAQERDRLQPAVVRPDEAAQESRTSGGPDTNDRAARVREALPASDPQVSAAPFQSATTRRVMQAPVVEAVVDATDPRPQLLARDLRQDEYAHVVPRGHAAMARLSADSVRHEPVDIDARPGESGRDGERGLLVPSGLGARIAADLQSSVSAANVRLGDRGAGPQRAAEGHLASAERNVQVTIGRIEVRATGSDKPAVRERGISPVMGLDEYLRRRARRVGQ
jgi:hypothetical protein